VSGVGRGCTKNNILRRRPCVQHGVQMGLMEIKDDVCSCVGTDSFAPGYDVGRDNGAKIVPKNPASHKCFRTALAASFVEGGAWTSVRVICSTLCDETRTENIASKRDRADGCQEMRLNILLRDGCPMKCVWDNHFSRLWTIGFGGLKSCLIEVKHEMRRNIRHFDLLEICRMLTDVTICDIVSSSRSSQEYPCDGCSEAEKLNGKIAICT
jgi:hypothetical protein